MKFLSLHRIPATSTTLSLSAIASLLVLGAVEAMVFGPPRAVRLTTRKVRMRRRLRFTRLRDDSGQGLVEFAIVLPLLVLLVVGIAQLGVAFHNYLKLTDAVRAGARAAAVAPAASACSAATTMVTAQLSSASVACTGSFTSGGQFTVTGTYYSPINIMGIVVSDGKLTSSSTERKEG
jgi:Flp pilus assembly protein TadG